MLVIARHLDGRKVKGRTTEFHPSRDFFRVETEPRGMPLDIPTEGLKAVFVVRSLEGNPDRRDHREFPRTPGQVRRKIWLEFKDGERMAAWPVSMPLGKDGFWVIPTDPSSNVERAYVFRNSVSKILQGDQAVIAAYSERERRHASEREAVVLRVL
ncbi:MAG: hypothetical protein U0167_14360 [bacterium]